MQGMMWSKQIALSLVALGTLAMARPATAQTGRVVLYNAGGAKLAEGLSAAFRKQQPGITVDVINAGVGELVTRIKAEKNNPAGDVLLGASVEAYEADPDLFEPYKTKEDAAFSRDVIGPNNLYYGYNLLLQTFMVNTKLLPADQAPKSWKDLGEPRFKGKIVFANPSLSGSAYGQFAQILQLYGWDTAGSLVKNMTFLNSSELVWQTVAKGENAVGVTGDNNVTSQAAAGYPVVAIYPSEGTALRFSATALIRKAPNPQNAKLLLDYLNGKEAHEITVQLTSRRSVRKDVISPPGQPATSDIKTFVYDDKLAAAKRDEYLEKFDDLLSQK